VDVPLTKLNYPLTKLWIFASFVGLGCGDPTESVDGASTEDRVADVTEDTPLADVVGVAVTGTEEAYVFSVTVRSDETGCDRYADWWEIITPAGQLVYRRILQHSHPDEQPFTRASETPVAVSSTADLYVRAHLSPGGYNGTVFGGTVANGFAEVSLDVGFAGDLASLAPQPEACLF